MSSKRCREKTCFKTLAASEGSDSRRLIRAFTVRRNIHHIYIINIYHETSLGPRFFSIKENVDGPITLKRFTGCTGRRTPRVSSSGVGGVRRVAAAQVTIIINLKERKYNTLWFMCNAEGQGRGWLYRPHLQTNTAGSKQSVQADQSHCRLQYNLWYFCVFVIEQKAFYVEPADSDFVSYSQTFSVWLELEHNHVVVVCLDGGPFVSHFCTTSKFENCLILTSELCGCSRTLWEFKTSDLRSRSVK